MTARLLFVLFAAVSAFAAWQSASAQAPTADPVIENPIIGERFSSDPAALVHDGRVWLYTGHDEAGTDAGFFEMHDWQLYSSDDMVNWAHHGSPISVETFDWARGDAWASQVIERDGKFYFYSTVRHDETKPGFAIGVAVADRPQGPFVDARGSALISNDMTDAPVVGDNEMDWDDLDPTVFIDDDEQAYLFWGNTVPRYAKLAQNMTELDGPIVELDLPHFTEALWIHEYDGTYYLSYAYGYPEQIAYATADEITGPYEFQGVINDRIPNSATNHQSIIEFDGDWYFFYHNAALPGGGEFRRSVAVERLFYDDDGRIHPITQAVDGLSVERPRGAAVFLASRAASEQDDEPEYVTNPVAPRVADPWVYKHTDGYYYLTGSAPAYDRIDIRRARTLQGLAFAEPVTVWRKHDAGPMSRHIWAPELHYIDGMWVVHFAAGREDDPFRIRMYAITTDAENPLEGAWTERGQVEANWESFSLDATSFEHRGTRYLVWAQHDPEIGGNTNLYIAEMDSPWSITGKQVMITTPEYDWEVQGYRVNEGAAVLKKHGRLWMTYSASATDSNYAMGLLWADADADLLDAASWTKSPVPVMTTSEENGVFGPGHNSFTVSEDGQYDILVYHARPYGNIRGNSLYDPNRQARMQVLRWADDGTPIFDPPVPDGPHVFGEAPIRAMIEASFDRAVEQYTRMDEAVPDTLLPRTTRPDGSLWMHEPGWWTSGFFPGSLWYLYEYTGDPEMKARAEARTNLIEGEKHNAYDHDIGFKINDSFGNALRITGDSSRYAPVIVTAAHTLLERFDPNVGLSRSWGDRNDQEAPYLVIIDNMMNLDLLFDAAELSGDSSFYDVAVSHADNTLRHFFRPDGSSYHVVEFDPQTGEVLRKRTAQGAADSSAWARGQAWGLYGFTETYGNTGDERYLEQAREIADFILTHPNLPDDGVPYWDFDAPGIPDTYRDASAAAIAASALLELSGYIDDDARRAAYRDAAKKMLRTLSGPEYLAEVGANNHFLLKHGVGSLPAGSEVDVPLTYGDYYFLEGLLRLQGLTEE